MSKKVFGVLIFLPMLGSCAQPGVEYKPSVRIGGVIADSIDTEISGLGYALGGETDYSSIEVGVGAAKYVDGHKRSLSEIVIAKSEFETLDAVEISGGGRFYFGEGESFAPFGSIYVTNSVSDYIPGTLVQLGTQIGLQLGIGGEYRLNEHFFLDTSFRYLIPLVAAESNTTPVVETEFDGYSIVISMGVEF